MRAYRVIYDLVDEVRAAPCFVKSILQTWKLPALAATRRKPACTRPLLDSKQWTSAASAVFDPG